MLLSLFLSLQIFAVMTSILALVRSLLSATYLCYVM